jgi:hypothetical protein
VRIVSRRGWGLVVGAVAKGSSGGESVGERDAGRRRGGNAAVACSGSLVGGRVASARYGSFL